MPNNNNNSNNNEEEVNLIDKEKQDEAMLGSQDMALHAKSTEFQVLTNLIKSSFGISVLVLPNAFLQIGVGLSILLFFLFGGMYYYGALTLANLANKYARKTKSYSEFLHFCFGTAGGRFGVLIIVLV